MDGLLILGAGLAGAGAPLVRRDDFLPAIPLAGLLAAVPLACSAIAIRMNRPIPGPDCRRCPECGRRFTAADEPLDHRAKTWAAVSIHVFTLAIITAATGRKTITGSHSGKAGSRNPGRFTLWQMNVNT